VNSPRRDEVWLVSLDPTQDSEIQKTRPCLVIIAPMTTSERSNQGSGPTASGS